MRIAIASLALSGLLLLAGCGGDTADDSKPPPGADTGTPALDISEGSPTTPPSDDK